jgi:hypothetical protein
MTAPDHMLEDANGTCMKRGIHTWCLRQTRRGSLGDRQTHDGYALPGDQMSAYVQSGRLAIEAMRENQ